MRVLIVVAAVLAAVSCQSSLTSSEEALHQHIRMQMLKRYIAQEQKLKMVEQAVDNICPGYGEKFEKVMEDITSCLDEVDLEQETICSAVKNNFATCMRPLIGMFEKCLPDNSKDLPSFLVQSSLSVTEKLCKTDGEHIFELSNQCIKSDSWRTKRCVRRIESKIQQIGRKKVPSKGEACEFLRSLRGCLQSHLTHSCGNPKTREAYLDVYDAVLAPCTGGSVNEIEDMTWETNVKSQ